VSFENAQRFQNSQKNSSEAAEGSDSKLAARHGRVVTVFLYWYDAIKERQRE